MAVTLNLEGNEPQRRATVAFRAILIIPHVLFALVLQVVAFVVIFFAWFAVLFTAQMPSGMGDFLRRVLQYQARVYAYGYLLTDRYPPFDVGPAQYPIELEVDEPGRFNRAAVLFRFVLQLWALVLYQTVMAGMYVLLFFVWLVTLVSGRLPSSAYLAFATILRYQLRAWAYMGMLTTEYPGGLLGDRGDPYRSPTIDDDIEPALPTSPRIDRFVLSRGAKALVWLALLFGIAFQVVNVAFTELGFGSTAKLADMDRDFGDAYDTWDDATRICTRTDAPAGCQAPVNAAFRDEIERYERRLLLLEVPQSAADEAVAVVAVLEGMHGLLGDMAEAGDTQEQLRLYLLIEDAKLDYDDEYDDLYTAVSFG